MLLSSTQSIGPVPLTPPARFAASEETPKRTSGFQHFRERSFLKRPFEEGSEQGRDIHILIVCALGLTGWGMFLSLLSRFIFNIPHVADATLLASLVGPAIAFLAWASGRAKLLRNLLLLDLYWILSHNVSHDGGIVSSIVAWYALIPLLSIFLGGRREAYGWVALSLSAIVYFWFSEKSGRGFRSDISQEMETLVHVVNYASICVAILGFSLYYEYLRRNTENNMNKLYHELSESKAHIAELSKLEAIGRLSGGIAHDFNNMLTVIEGRSTQVQESLKKGDPNVQRMEIIQNTTKRAVALTKQLLAFGRGQFMRPQAVSLSELFAQMRPMLRSVLSESIAFNDSIYDDLPQVLIDPAQLEQVVVNLVLNARDAMPEGGALHLSAERAMIDPEIAGVFDIHSGVYVVLRVRDTGIGMDEAIRKRVFEPFFTTKPVGQGTGLGLSSAYGIIRQSGGEITVESTPGKGTTFSIYLPVADPLPESQAPSA